MRPRAELGARRRSPANTNPAPSARQADGFTGSRCHRVETVLPGLTGPAPRTWPPEGPEAGANMGATPMGGMAVSPIRCTPIPWPHPAALKPNERHLCSVAAPFPNGPPEAQPADRQISARHRSAARNFISAAHSRRTSSRCAPLSPKAPAKANCVLQPQRGVQTDPGASDGFPVRPPVRSRPPGHPSGPAEADGPIFGDSCDCPDAGKQHPPGRSPRFLTYTVVAARGRTYFCSLELTDTSTGRR